MLTSSSQVRIGRGSPLQLKDDTGKVIAEAVTDSSGDYELEDIPTGSYKFHVQCDKKFRYMCTSPAEFRAVTESYDVLLNEPGKMDIGLMEGYLTLPFAKNTVETCRRVYVDVDKTPSMRDWQGGRNTYNGHLGTDFCLRIGTKILTAAPGYVAKSYHDEDDGNVLAIRHSDGNLTIYCHLEDRVVYPAQELNRGDIVGVSGHTGKLAGPNPHLHFQFGGYGNERIDPYRDLSNPLSLCFWSKDNDLQFPPLTR